MSKHATTTRNQRFPIASLLLACMVLLTACGGGGEESLEQKQDKLTALKTEYKALGKQISDLEKEIVALDPRQAKDPRIPVVVEPAKTGTFRRYVKLQGQIETDENVMVSPKMPGVYEKIHVEEGQMVTKGQLIATLDDGVLVRSLAELATQLELADSIYRKQSRLWKQQIGSEVQLLQAKANKESVERRIATTEEQKSMYKVTAPISGVVDAVIAKQGEGAAPGMGAVRLVNLSDLKFTAAVSEAYIPFIHKGNEVELYFPTIDQTLKAKVSAISQTINPQNRTVQVTVDISGRQPLLKANMVGEISICDITHEDALIVPLSYMRKTAEGSVITVAEKNDQGEYVAQNLIVKAGESYGGQVEIISGLKRGHLIIKEGFEGLKNGQPVKFDGASDAKTVTQ